MVKKSRKTKKTSNADKKAYKAKDWSGELCAIIFAKSNVEARRFAAARFDCDVESVVRAAQYDEYKYSGVVPPAVLISNGWWFECYHTGEHVNSDTPHFYVDDKDNVYINYEAYRKSLRYNIRRKIKAESVLSQTHRKFPFAQEIKWNESYKETPEKVRCPVVTFKFHDNAKSRVEYMVGTDFVTLSKEDLDLWNVVSKAKIIETEKVE